MAKEKKVKKESKRDKEIREASEDMDSLIDSIKDQMGVDVKVVKIKIPKPTFSNFIIELIIGFILNSLLILGTSGYFDYLVYSSIWSLLLFSFYFTLIEKIVSNIIIGFFPSLIIKTMGLANFIPIGVTLILTLVLPIFVKIDNIGLAIIMFVLILGIRMFLKSFFLEKQIKKKMRGIK